MTKPAMIPQAETARACKAVAEAGFQRARIILDLANQRIEIIIGESDGPAPGAANPLDRFLQNGS